MNTFPFFRKAILVMLLGLLTTPAYAAYAGPQIAGIPVDFILFALTLLGVALFHHHTLKVALGGLGVVVIYKLLFTGFKHEDALPTKHPRNFYIKVNQ